MIDILERDKNMEDKLLLHLRDGGIVNIYTDETHYDGCPTCDYGSSYISSIDIFLTKYKISAEITQMYYYALNVEDTLKLFLLNINEIMRMTESEFIEWFKDWWYDKAGYSNNQETEDVIFNVTEIDN